MTRVEVEFEVVNVADRTLCEEGHLPADKVRRVRLAAVADPKAAMLVLPESVAKALGLLKTGVTKVRYGDGRTVTRDIVGQAEVEMFGRRSIFAAVADPERSEALIGMILLGSLDLLVDVEAGTLLPRDPDQILTEIE